MNNFIVEESERRVGACALILNKRNELLIVRPSYREYWSLPGGIVERNEAPSDACIREVKEEIGLDIVAGKCLCVFWQAGRVAQDESLRFVFYGCVVSEPLLDSIVPTSSEITACGFWTADEALSLLGGVSRRMVPIALAALGHDATVYYENPATSPAGRN